VSGLSAQEIAARRDEVLSRVARAAGRAGRDPTEVSLLAVTKTHSAEVVRQAALSGMTLFGENRVAEGVGKIQAVSGEFPGLEWRLIGPLQTNKAKPALQYFSVIESLDREKLATRLEGLAAGEARRFPVLLEINLGGEETKSGASPEEAGTLAAFVVGLPHLELRGLMAVPPFTPDPEGARPYFKRLKEIRDRLADGLGRPLPDLSMGMSHDLEVAVEEGATEIRVGTALFGERPEA
jgi:pyridoxal phosphate enzyme (YggS family)